MNCGLFGDRGSSYYFFIFTKILTVHMNLEAKVIDLDKLPIQRGGTIPWWYYTLRV